MIGDVKIKSSTTERELTVSRVVHIAIRESAGAVTITKEDSATVLIVPRLSDVRLTPCRDWRARPAYVVLVDRDGAPEGRLADD